MREAERSKNDPGMVGNGDEFLVVCGVGGGGIDFGRGGGGMSSDGSSVPSSVQYRQQSSAWLVLTSKCPL